MSRVILIVLAIPVFIVLMAALLLPLLLDEKDLLNMAAKVVKDETGAILSVNGEANLSVFPKISVDLSDTEITMPGESEPSIKARFLGIGLELMPLFSGSVKVGEVAIDGLVMTLQAAPEEAPVLETAGLTDEQLDVFYEERRKALDSAAEAAGEQAPGGGVLALNVQRLLVTDSVVEILSAETQERTRIELINLEATDVNLEDRAVPVTMKVRLEAGKEAQPIDVALASQLRINAATSKMKIDELVLEVLGVLEDPVSVEAAGEIDLARQAVDLTLDLAVGDIRGDGKLHFASFETPQIDTQLHLNIFDPDLLVMAGSGASPAEDGSEQTEPAATGSAAERPAPDGSATAGSGSSESPAESAPDTGDGGDQPLPLDALRGIDARVIVLIDRAVFSGHAVEKMDVKIRVVDGVARINNLTGDLHGGKLDMKAVFDGKHNVAVLRTTGGLKGLELAAALKAMESDPIASGEANLEWNLNSSGSTSNQLVGGMKGPINLLTSEVTLESMGIEKMLCEAVALTNGESMSKTLPERTVFQNLSVKLKMDEGKVNMAPMRAELASIKLQGKGAMDLLKQDFSATITARLSAGLGQLDPACRVSERITGIGWPVNCSGSLSGDPADWCAVDSSKIIKDLATKEVQRKVEKEAGKLFEKLFGK